VVALQCTGSCNPAATAGPEAVLLFDAYLWYIA